MNGSALLLCFLFFLIAACKKPGYLENTDVDFLKMLVVVESTQLCPDCETIRTSRSRHCSVCKRCIERFDHHCPWINNCVGQANMKYFLQFVTYIMLASAMLSLLCVLSFYNLLTSPNTRLHMNHAVSPLAPLS